MTLSPSSYSPSRGPSILLLALVAGCASADTRVDPGDLALRDLLGVAPATAAGWDGQQRAAARRVLEAGLAADEPLGIEVGLGAGLGLDERVARALAGLDAERDHDGEPALGVVQVAVLLEPRALRVAAAVRSPDDTAVDVVVSEAWADDDATADLPARAAASLRDLARRAGHRAGPLVAMPSPRLATIAAYIEPALAGSHAGADGRAHLLVNPVLLAAIEPEAGEPAAALAGPAAPKAAGNPYSFYGSVAECAQAQRLRCEACAPTGDCVAVTDSDGATECARLAEDGGRGYFLLCINLSLAITGVAECAADGAPACPRDEDASRTLAELAQNASFLDDTTCGAVLDGCLADLYGEPDDDFPAPGGPDAGPDPAPAPRDTSVGCTDSSANCELSPSCDVTGPSCDNSVTCDGGCSDSSSQSGCDGTCDACESSDGDGGSCVSCESDDGTGGDSGSCDSGDGGNSDGGSCDSGDGSSGDGCSGGDCGGDSDCGGGDCGSNGGCGDCDSGGSSGSCSVAHRKRPPAGLALTVAMLWAFLPVPLAVRARRRARRARAAGGAL
jgi:hypothetical protein